MPIFYSKIRCFCLFTTCSIVSFVYHIWYKFRLFTLCIHSAWGCSGACCGAVQEGQSKTVQDAGPGDMQGLSASLCINREKRRLPLGISHGRRQHITRSLIIINSLLTSPPVQDGGTGLSCTLIPLVRPSLCSPARHGRSSLPGRNPRCFFCRSDQCTSLPSPSPADGSW